MRPLLALCCAAGAAQLGAAAAANKASRIQGALFGTLVADALCLGSHYEYDAKKIKAAYGGKTIDRYLAAGERMGGQTHGVGWGKRNYHPGTKSGDQTDYGEYNVLVLEHLYEQRDPAHPFEVAEMLPVSPARRARTGSAGVHACARAHSAPRSVLETAPRRRRARALHGEKRTVCLCPHRAHRAPAAPAPAPQLWKKRLESWKQWMCTQTKQTRQQLAQGTPLGRVGGGSNAMALRAAAAFAYYDSEDAVVDATRKSMFTHRNGHALGGGDFFAKVTYRVIHKGAIPPPPVPYASRRRAPGAPIRAVACGSAAQRV